MEKEKEKSQDMKDVKATNAAIALITRLQNSVDYNLEYTEWKMLYRVEGRLRDRSNEILKSLQGEE